MFGTPRTPRAMFILIMYCTKLNLNQCIIISTLKGGGGGVLVKCCFCKNVIGQSMYFFICARAVHNIFATIVGL